jgi:transposase InsO family protein
MVACVEGSFQRAQPLPRKAPKYVAFELSKIFGLLGYPNIFHTDSGKEFTAKTILDMLKLMNNNIITPVTGRPRKPNDQGSVEKLAKRVMPDLEETEHQNGRQANWTMLQGSVMAAVNKQCGKGRDSVSAYESVFGMPYDPQLPCSHEDLWKCKTIQQQMKLVSSPRLDNVARELYQLDEDSNEDCWMYPMGGGIFHPIQSQMSLSIRTTRTDTTVPRKTK